MYGSKLSNYKYSDAFGQSCYITFLEFFMANQKQCWMSQMFSHDQNNGQKLTVNCGVKNLKWKIDVLKYLNILTMVSCCHWPGFGIFTASHFKPVFSSMFLQRTSAKNKLTLNLLSTIRQCLNCQRIPCGCPL